MSLQTIFRSIRIVDVHFAKSLLDGAGIRSFIHQEYVSGLFPHLSFQSGGARLKVQKEDAEHACQILDEHFHAHKEQLRQRSKLSKFPNTTDCPYCRKTNVHKKRPKFRWVLLLFPIVLVIFLFSAGKSYYCSNCDSYWRT